ncbi:MAG: endonuclease/exonuclease/phosphatase family protein [Planctomycetota bacterium]|nr:endonuclease/exonuclease/phosphatase family protein [Planctomycetota bacterium]
MTTGGSGSDNTVAKPPAPSSDGEPKPAQAGTPTGASWLSRQIIQPGRRISLSLAWLSTFGATVSIVFGRLWPQMLDLTHAGFFVRFMSWLAMLARTFEFHAALAAGAGVILATLGKGGMRRRAAIAVGLFASAWGLAPEAWTAIPPDWRSGGGPGGTAAASRPTTPSLSPSPRDQIVLVTANVLVGDRPRLAKRLLAMVDEEKPDVLLLQEWDEHWARRAEPELRKRFSHVQGLIGPGAFGQAVCTNIEPSGPIKLYPPFGPRGAWMTPQMRLILPLAGPESRPPLNVLIQNIHLLSPSWQNNFDQFVHQREEVRDLGIWLEGRPGDEARHLPEGDGALVLAGDFNMHPTSAYAQILRDAGLRDAHREAGFGRGTTWPRVSRLRYAPGIRLDQVWVRGGLRVVECRTLADIGSDHRPVLVRLRRAD